MKVLIFVATMVITICALSEQEHWNSFKLKHGKTYSNIVEEKLRFQIFKDNFDRIEKHNIRYENGEVKYYLGVNKFADITEKEFSELLLLQVSSNPEITKYIKEFPKDVKLPDSIDWRQKGAVLGIKDQGNCGSCWSFGTTGALEGQNAILNNVSIPLSEKQLMDCSRRYGNNGCYGGTQLSAFDYVIDYGIQSESSYPYSTNESECKYSENEVVLKIKTYETFEQTEEALKTAIATVGPITVSIMADPLQFYEGGIYDDVKACKNSAYYLDHAVLAIGYGIESENEYWLLKNSWGPDWGEEGFFKLHRNYSVCGILLDTSYPVIN